MRLQNVDKQPDTTYIKAANRVLSMVLLLFAAGCGTTRGGIYLNEDVAVLPAKPYQVGIIDADSFNFSFDFLPYFRSGLEKALAKQHLLANAEDHDVLVLDVHVVEYEPGDAMERWLIGSGAGQTYAEVFVSIMNWDRSVRVGALHIQKNISWGGLYSVGAYKTIWLGMAEKIAKSVAQGKIVKGQTLESLRLESRLNPEYFSNGFAARSDAGKGKRNIPDFGPAAMRKVDKMTRLDADGLDLAVAKVEKLAALLENGKITQSEYDAKKEELLQVKVVTA